MLSHILIKWLQCILSCVAPEDCSQITDDAKCGRRSELLMDVWFSEHTTLVLHFILCISRIALSWLHKSECSLYIYVMIIWTPNFACDFLPGCLKDITNLCMSLSIFEQSSSMAFTVYLTTKIGLAFLKRMIIFLKQKWGNLFTLLNV